MVDFATCGARPQCQLRQLPPVLDLDVHEMGAYTYFFPPNSDPVYHEIADISNIDPDGNMLGIHHRYAEGAPPQAG